MEDIFNSDESIASSTTELMMTVAEGARSVESSARWFRDHMIENGWDSELAEQVASSIFFGAFERALSSAQGMAGQEEEE